MVQPWLATVARVGLGVVWMVAGALKVGDLAASGRAVAAYRLLPFDVAMAYGAVQPFLEIALGRPADRSGFATRLAAGVSAVLLVAFIVGHHLGLGAWAADRLRLLQRGRRPRARTAPTATFLRQFGT